MDGKPVVHAAQAAFSRAKIERASHHVHYFVAQLFRGHYTSLLFRKVAGRNALVQAHLSAGSRLSGALAVPAFAVCLLAVSCGSFHLRDTTSSWYPLDPGNSWIYQQEALSGDMAHPEVERSTIEEKIIGSVKAPEVAGTLVTKTITVLTGAARAPFETHILIRESCVYLLDGPEANGAADVQVSPTQTVSALDGAHHIRPEYRGALLRRDVPPDFCFPLATGDRWGRVATTSPAEEFVWEVTGVNADPFGAPGVDTFHMWTPLGSGEVMDRWFAKGIGVLHEVEEHHGTYDEDRRQLVSATIRGKTQTFDLKRARTVPLGPDDCEGPGWQHFARPDGSLFGGLADCTNAMSSAVK